MRHFRNLLIFSGITFGALASTTVIADDTGLPDAPGREQVLQSCTQCHGIDLFAQPRPAEEWSQVVSLMIGNGMYVTDEQYNTILDYLSTNMTPQPSEPTPTNH